VEIDKSHHVTHNFDQRSLGEQDELLIGSKEGAFTAKPVTGGTKWEVRALECKNEDPEDQASPGQGELRYWNAKGPGKFDFVAVEPFHGNVLAAYRQQEDGKSWLREIVDEDTLNQGHALACGDILGLGSEQIVVGWREPNGEQKVGIRLWWPANPGVADGKWLSAWLADNTVACEDLKLADMDGDGDLDVIAAGRSTKNLLIGWNETRQ
jgi:hypothetical protein